MLVTIDPDHTVSYTSYQVFCVTFPITHIGVVVIGDTPFPYTTYAEVSTIMPAWNNVVFFTLSKTTRVRIYYVLVDPMIDIEPIYDDFIITITDSKPIVSLANYGEVVTFPSSTTATIEVNIPCSVTYKLVNLDQGIIETAIVDVTTTHNIPLAFNGSIVLNATANGFSAPEQVYYFKKEPEGSQTVYTAWAEGTMDNFTGMPPFGE